MFDAISCLDCSAAIALYVAQRPAGVSHESRNTQYHDRDAVRNGEERPPGNLSQLYASAMASRTHGILRQRGACISCALVSSNCICASLAALRLDVERQIVDAAPGDPWVVRFGIWMHVREWCRASNTGKLLLHVLPDCEVFLHEVPEDELRFQHAVHNVGGRVVVLFPSATATPASTVQLSNTGDSSSSLSTMLVILVDGTWHQAKRMHRKLEAFPHIALEPSGPSAFRGRRQSLDGRVSTVEAAMLLLECLAPKHTTIQHALSESLAILDGALENQAGYSRLSPPEHAPRPARTPKGLDHGAGASRSSLSAFTESKPLCRHHQKGRCLYGGACAFQHAPLKAET